MITIWVKLLFLGFASAPCSSETFQPSSTEWICRTFTVGNQLSPLELEIQFQNSNMFLCAVRFRSSESVALKCPQVTWSTYSGWAGGAFVKGQAGWQHVVKPWKKASNLWEKNQHIRKWHNTLYSLICKFQLKNKMFTSSCKRLYNI